MLQRFFHRRAIQTDEHQLLVDVGFVADQRNAELFGLQLGTYTLQRVGGLTVSDVRRGGVRPGTQRSTEQVLAFEQQPGHTDALGEPHGAAGLLFRGTLATSAQVRAGEQYLGESLAAGQAESGEHARRLADESRGLFDALGLVPRQQQDRPRESAARPPHQIADVGKFSFRPKQAVQRVVEPAQSTTLG